jgi:hypothetical protein
VEEEEEEEEEGMNERKGGQQEGTIRPCYCRRYYGLPVATAPLPLTCVVQ